jgi:hypothetical protein
MTVSPPSPELSLQPVKTPTTITTAKINANTFLKEKIFTFTTPPFIYLILIGISEIRPFTKTAACADPV